MESLKVGSGSELDLQTFKVIDQRTGRILGVRADMTSQAARIDAHSLGGNGVQRLCYAGTVIHAHPASVLDSRVPLKAGAEIFGAPNLAADAEVVAALGVDGINEKFDLGYHTKHVDTIFKRVFGE